MTENRSDRIEALFYQVVDLPPAEQRVLLDTVCHDDPSMRAEIEKLLADDARFSATGQMDFLQSPLIRAATPDVFTPKDERIGNYRLVRLLGEGGMGAVYEAEQDSPRRRVALKVLRSGLVTQAMLGRFAQEGEILGRLHHPGIAQIYEAGVARNGQPFFALELIHGLHLDRYARHHQLEVSARLGLMAQVCDAVQHAHAKGIIHRDLKPANILVDETGQPKVLDFGIARTTDTELLNQKDQTRTGQLLGTLLYMSPEQVASNRNELDQRSDVYTLGVILFELLTGRLPYALDRLPLPEAVQVIRQVDPLPLGTIDARLRGDVAIIVGKALEKEVGRRYSSAAELAADIRRHLRSEPIRARPPSAFYHVSKFVRRHRTVVFTTAAFLLLLLGGGALTAWQAVRLAQGERDQVVQQARRSQDVHEALTQATALREQARNESNLAKWTEARAMARRAEALVESGPVDSGLATRVAELLRELNAEADDRQLVARLEEIRLYQAEVNVKENRFALERAIPEYRQTFAEYGLRSEQSPAEAVALLKSRPLPIRTQVITGLDNWLSLARPRASPEVAWLEKILADADPDNWRQRLRVAMAQRSRPALEELAREAKIADQPPHALLLLTDALQASGSTDEAIRLLKRNQEANPADFWINHNLGMALGNRQPPQIDESIRFLTAAVALRPKSPGALLNLGTALQIRGRLVEAAAAFSRVLTLKPDYAIAHGNLGIVQRAQGNLVGAATSFRRVIELDPKSASAQCDLGVLLRVQGDLSGARTCFQRAIQIDPRSLNACYNLGVVLQEQGDLAGAAAQYRQAITIDSKVAEVHCNLGNVLFSQGDFRAALAEMRIGHDLGSRRKDWTYPSAALVSRFELVLRLESRLPEFLSGKASPSETNERLHLAEICYCKQLHVSSVRFYLEAVAHDAKVAEDLTNGHRYRAACAAALAACGQGEEASSLTLERRLELRQQAMAWLRADLTLWSAMVREKTAGTRWRVARTLSGWQSIPALASVRDPASLATLPPAEKSQWRQLWKDVADLVATAREAK